MPAIIPRIEVVTVLAAKARVDAALLIEGHHSAVGLPCAGFFGQALHHPFWVACARIVADDKVFTKHVGGVEGWEADLGPFVEVVCLVLGLGVGCFFVVTG